MYRKDLTNNRLLHRYQPRNDLGRSMIEMLGVLAIIGVLSVGGIAGYSKAMTKFKTNKIADNISMIVANIKTLYAQQKSYDGLTIDTANDMGILPDELIKKEDDGSTIYRHAFNGEVWLHTASSTDKRNNDNKAFILYFGGLSKEACIALATNDWGSSYSSGLIALHATGISAGASSAYVYALDWVTIGDNEKAKLSDNLENWNYAIAMPGATGAGQVHMPMPVTTAASACSCNNGDTCAIMLKYY